jgi:hypothetical protein
VKSERSLDQPRSSYRGVKGAMNFALVVGRRG